jgi:hypothetical protein
VAERSPRPGAATGTRRSRASMSSCCARFEVARREGPVARAWGPAGPELLCDECFHKLDEYVELELHRADADEACEGLTELLHGEPHS